MKTFATLTAATFLCIGQPLTALLILAGVALSVVIEALAAARS